MHWSTLCLWSLVAISLYFWLRATLLFLVFILLAATASLAWRPLPPGPTPKPESRREPIPSAPLDIQWNKTWFGYPPISDTAQIRLLEITSVSPDPASPKSIPRIKGVLYTCDLAELAHTSYIALSYQWGGDPTADTDNGFIWINGKRFCLRLNVIAFLRHYDQICDRTHGGRFVIYIDAICINQSDAVEKAHQVQHMRDVYSQAQRVVVWLCPLLSRQWLCTEQRIDRLDRRAKVCLEKMKTDHIFSDNYWTRVWIVQEVLLARQLMLLAPADQGTAEGLVLLDLDDLIRTNDVPRLADEADDLLGWDVSTQSSETLVHKWSLEKRLARVGPRLLGAAREAIERRRTQARWATEGFEQGRASAVIKAKPKRSTFVPYWGLARDVMARRKAWVETPLSKRVHQQTTLTIMEIVNLAGSRQCSFAVDRIFGFLGLLERSEYLIRPDYTKSKNDIYADVLPHLFACVHAKNHTTPTALLADLDDGYKKLFCALEIDKWDRDCARTTLLLLHLLGIPDESIRSLCITTSLDMEEGLEDTASVAGVIGSFLPAYRTLAFCIAANRGMGPYIRYLDEKLEKDDTVHIVHSIWPILSRSEELPIFTPVNEPSKVYE